MKLQLSNISAAARHRPTAYRQANQSDQLHERVTSEA